MRKVLGTLILAVVATAMLLAGPAASPAGASETSDFSAAINAVRAGVGLPGLTVDGELSAVAQQWAQRMADAGQISHNPGLNGQVTADWRTLGENVGVAGEVGSMMRAFVASPGHYANLVRPEFTHVGIGVVRTGDGKLWAVHVFMGLRGGAVPAPTPEPEPVPEPAAEPAPAPEPEAPPAPPARRPEPAPAPAPDPVPVAEVRAPAPPAQATRVATVLAALRSVQG